MKTCESSLNGKTTLFHSVDSGSTPTFSHIRIVECKFKDIRHIFEQYHYKGGHMGGGISYCLALTDGLEIIGGVVIGKLRHDKKYSNGVIKTVELRRMACLEKAPKNIESYFLAKVNWWLKKNTDIQKVISYSDKSVGHTGTIYKAANYKLIGETAPSKHVWFQGKRYHPRSLTINRPYSYKMREGLKTGETIIETGEPKLIYEYIIRK